MAYANAVDVGPWGGAGGDSWKFNGDIRRIVIRYGDVVDSLTITYIDGELEKLIKVGGPKGDNEATVPMADGEFLVTIEGVVNNSQSVTVVASLTFVTNLRRYGPFGPVSDGTPFSLPVKVGKSAGLFGRAGNFLDAIGISLVPNGGNVELGPWGGVGGTPWAYYDDVRRFDVAYIEEAIVSITLNNSRFGGIGGTPVTVTLESDEYLRSIKGSTRKHEDGGIVLQTIGFVSNKRTYGPYGKAGAGAVLFDAPVINGHIRAFSGRQGAWIDAISFEVVTVRE